MTIGHDFRSSFRWPAGAAETAPTPPATIHLASAPERAQADALVRSAYARRGLGEHGLPDRGDTFIVCSDAHMVGTLTLAVDEQGGLPADGMFGEELDRLRLSGARLCELTRFALETQSASARVFHDLFRAIHRHGVRNYDCTDLVIQAHPRHCWIYRRRLGFKPLGATVINPEYYAPAQLMRIDVAELDRHFQPMHHVENWSVATDERRLLRAG